MVLANKKEKKKKKKKHRWANNASQAIVLPTTKLASIAQCYFSHFTLFFFAFFPHQGAWSQDTNFFTLFKVLRSYEQN